MQWQLGRSLFGMPVRGSESSPFRMVGTWVAALHHTNGGVVDAVVPCGSEAQLEPTIWRLSSPIKHQLRLVRTFELSWLRNQTGSRAGAHCYEGLAGASRGEKGTPSGCSAPARKVVGLTLSQLDLNAAASQQMFWTEQERRLTSRHSFFDANPLASSGPVSVANPSDGHRNCQTVEKHCSMPCQTRHPSHRSSR